MSFRHLKVGDVVTRLLGGTIPMEMRVTEVTEEHIHCGPWCFDIETGAEEDEELGWGVGFGSTGSFLVRDEEKASS